MLKTQLGYREIALKEYENLKLSQHLIPSITYYNTYAACCAQVCEKIMKAVIVKLPSDGVYKVLSTHSLVMLYEELMLHYDVSSLDTRVLKAIEDSYFEYICPKDSYCEVELEDIYEFIRVTDEVVLLCERILNLDKASDSV